jgi:hypothetical protein
VSHASIPSAAPSRRGRRLIAAAGVVAAAVLTVPAAAQAVTVQVVGDADWSRELRIAERTAAEENDLRITAAGAVLTIHDAAGATTPRGSGCTQVDALTVTCAVDGPAGVVPWARVNVGEGDDRVEVADAMPAVDDLGHVAPMWLTVIGGAGADVLLGGPTPARLLGGDGADVITAGGASDLVEGGSGRDTIATGAGDDSVSSTAADGDDVIDLGEHEQGDSLVFADDDEVGRTEDIDADLRATPGTIAMSVDGAVTETDTVSGVERLRTSVGDDRIQGGAADEVLQGDRGEDVITGGDGDDVLLGEGGIDRMSGQGGDDTLFAHDADGEDVADVLACDGEGTGRAGGADVFHGAGPDVRPDDCEIGAPRFTGAPHLTGQWQVGGTLTLADAAVEGHPAPVVTATWLSCGDGDGSADPCVERQRGPALTYVPVSADAGRSLHVRLEADNGAHTDAWVDQDRFTIRPADPTPVPLPPAVGFTPTPVPPPTFGLPYTPAVHAQLRTLLGAEPARVPGFRVGNAQAFAPARRPATARGLRVRSGRLTPVALWCPGPCGPLAVRATLSVTPKGTGRTARTRKLSLPSTTARPWYGQVVPVRLRVSASARAALRRARTATLRVTFTNGRGAGASSMTVPFRVRTG